MERGLTWVSEDLLFIFPFSYRLGVISSSKHTKRDYKDRNTQRVHRSKPEFASDTETALSRLAEYVFKQKIASPRVFKACSYPSLQHKVFHFHSDSIWD